MKNKIEPNYFTTDQLALCGYLEIKGLKYYKADVIVGKNNRKKVLFYFIDPDHKGKDLEIQFRMSDEKKYKDLLFFYKKVINEKLKN